MEKDIVTKGDIRKLVDGTISWEDAKKLLKMSEKDGDRFSKYIGVLQERVPWQERILMRISDHLYIVTKKPGERIVKCDCGHEFGDYRVNWKLNSLVYTRKSLEEFKEVYYPEFACPEPEWQEIREYYCPQCAAQIGVEVVAPGCPPIYELFPDLDRFYRDWLNSPLEDEQEDWFKEMIYRRTEEWLKGAR